MKFNLKSSLIAGSVIFTGLVAGCQSPNNQDTASTYKNVMTNEFIARSSDWIAAKEEDQFASEVKVSRIEPDVYRMVFSIDYAALDKGSFGYDGSSMGFFVTCSFYQVLQKKAEKYTFIGQGKGEPNGDGMLPQTPFVVYLGFSDLANVPPVSKNDAIIWDVNNGEATETMKTSLKSICSNVFSRYPN
jgi:hypothetical protein